MTFIKQDRMTLRAAGRRKPSVLWLLWALLLAGSSVEAQVTPTSTWTDFFSGNSTINDEPLDVGSIIEAYDPDGVLCGSFTVEDAGKYGYLHVYGDDGTTPGIDEGATEGDTINFTINGEPAEASVVALWRSGTPGDILEIDLSMLIDPPDIVALSAPADSAVVRGDTVIFRWHKSSPAVSGYLVEYDTTDSFVTAVADSSPGIGDTLLAVTGMVIDHDYYWRVKAKNAVGWGPYSETRYFRLSAVGVSGELALPGGFRLRQNYPNPFNPVTTIRYTLPVSGEILLTIYNLRGEEMERLVGGEQTAGNHTVEWDASVHASGIYIYRLSASGFVQTRKMVLLK